MSEHLTLQEGVGYTENSLPEQIQEPPTAEEYDRDLGFTEIEDLQDLITDKNIEISCRIFSRYACWLMCSLNYDHVITRFYASAYVIKPKLFRTQSSLSEHIGVSVSYISNSIDYFSRSIVKWAEYTLGDNVTNYFYKYFNGYMDWVLSTNDPECVKTRVLASVFVMHRELLGGVNTIPDIAKQLNITKQLFSYHVDEFRSRFAIHMHERRGNCRVTQSKAARESWARRRSAQENRQCTEP